MNRFVNREASDLNKRKLRVLDTKLKGNGEIEELDVEVLRVDGVVETAGTPLEADAFNEIIRNIIREEVPLVSLQAKLIEVKDELNIPSIITSDTVSMPTYIDGVTITWTSSNSNVISPNGYVYRSDIDKEVVLRATFTLSEYTIEKTYYVVVKALSDESIVAEDKRQLDIVSETDSNFSLPITGVNGSSISWVSTDTDVISISGSTAIVTQGNADQTVILIATISYGSEVDTKTFYVEVTGTGVGGNSFTNSCSFSNLDMSFNYFTSSPQTEYLTVYANGGSGIYVNINNPYSNYFNITSSGDNSGSVTISVSEKSSNMPNKDNGYDFEVEVRNLNDSVIETRIITIAYI